MKMLLFREKLNHPDWNSVYVSNDVHEAYDGFFVLHGLRDECFPIIIIYDNNKNDKQWITHELK